MRHPFYFDGGEELTTMGACWFVSYCYYIHIDSNHLAWNKVKTSNNRRSVYNRTINYHKYWLEKITQMNDDNLNKNTIGLKSDEIKKMAQDLLAKI